MAIAAISHCLARYGEATLITALHCVTQTTNNQPGLLTGRMIKALCVVLDGDHDLRDRGLALLEAFEFDRPCSNPGRSFERTGEK